VSLPSPRGDLKKWWTAVGPVVVAPVGIWVVWKASGLLSMIWRTRPTTVGRSLIAAWFVSAIGFAVSILFFAIIRWREEVPPFEHGGLWSFVLDPRPADGGRARFWFRMRVIILFFLTQIVAMGLFTAAEWAGLTR
jgi:hypothetical protein